MEGFKVYLSKDELKEINKGEKITIVGKIDKINENNNIQSILSIANGKILGEMKDAYLIGNSFTITGTFSSKYKGTLDLKNYRLETQENEVYILNGTYYDNPSFYFGKNKLENNEFVDGDKIEIIGTPTFCTGNGWHYIGIENIQSVKKINAN